MKTQNSFVWNRNLAIAAWTVFTVSFVLPSYAEMRGFQCALSQAFFWPRAIHGDWASIHYLLLTFTNLLMVSSPLVLWRLVPDGLWLKILRYFTVIALALGGSFLMLLYPRGMWPYLKVGSYAWAGSFVLLYFATFVPPGSRQEGGALRIATLCA